MPGHLDVIEIPSADPITMALGGDNDIAIAQLDNDGRGPSVYFDVRMPTRWPQRSSRWRRTSGGR